VIFLNLGEKEAAASMKVAKTLRATGITSEVYPDSAKMKKQMTYADAMHIPFVAIIGESELEADTVTLKNMAEGTQESLSINALATRLA
jgi:histidyl-tRNA synthetase